MTYDFCGIGNACVDIVAKVEDSFLEEWKFQKSICTYLTLDPANKLEAALPSPEYIPGGCGANTASIVSALGGKSAFIGRVAQDSVGQIFLDDMKARGIRYVGQPDTSEGAGSTRIFAMTTPDTERTFAAYYGVQEQLSIADLDIEALQNTKFLYLDGYALNSRRGEETFLKAAEITKEAGNRVVFSPSDLSILSKYDSVVASMMKVSDGIVCNTGEAMYLTREDTPERAIASLQKQFKFGGITSGAEGVYAFDKSHIQLIPATTPPGPVVDTNGAGDGFAGGFLYGLAQGYDVDRAAALGNSCAATIITHYGARPKESYQHLL
jgi:sugar/nucleoside kinase (ribokinase family)